MRIHKLFLFICLSILVICSCCSSNTNYTVIPTSTPDMVSAINLSFCYNEESLLWMVLGNIPDRNLLIFIDEARGNRIIQAIDLFFRDKATYPLYLDQLYPDYLYCAPVTLHGEKFRIIKILPYGDEKKESYQLCFDISDANAGCCTFPLKAYDSPKWECGLHLPNH
jgi:hypothetical protein